MVCKVRSLIFFVQVARFDKKRAYNNADFLRPHFAVSQASLADSLLENTVRQRIDCAINCVCLFFSERKYFLPNLCRYANKMSDFRAHYLPSGVRPSRNSESTNNEHCGLSKTGRCHFPVLVLIQRWGRKVQI